MGRPSVSRQNLGAIVVSLAVVLGLVVVVFILPAIQPKTVVATNELDEAATRAARRLEVITRVVPAAVAADKAQLSLPAEVISPDEEALQRAAAEAKGELLTPTRELNDRIRRQIEEQDKRYTEVEGEAPAMDPAVAEALQVPSGEASQVTWLKQSFSRRSEAAAEALKDISAAIGDLEKSMNDAASAGVGRSDHHRANWVLAGLQHQKAMLLANLAANRRARATEVRRQVLTEYGWHGDAAGQAKAIQARLQEMTLSTPQPAAPVAPVAEPAAVAEPATAEPAAEAAAAPAESQGDGILGRIASAIQTAPPAEPAVSEPGAAVASAAPAGASAAAGAKVLAAATEPAAVVQQYEQDVDQQIATSQKRIAELQQAMAEPQQKLEQAKAEAQQLQQQLAELERAGYDVTKMESFEQYKAAYAALTEKARRVETAIQELQDGTMAGAEPDPASIEDDLTKVKYLGGEAQVGLTTLSRRLEGEQKVLADLQAARQELQNLRASMEAYKKSQDGTLEQATARADEVAGQLTKTLEQLDGLVREAASREEEALAACDAAERAFTTALQAAKSQQNKAREELSIAQPAPDKPNLRLDALVSYDSPQAACEHALAGVYMLKAEILLRKAMDMQLHVGVLEIVQAGGAASVENLDQMQQAIRQALDDAMLALTAQTADGGSDNALAHAEAFERLVSKEKFAWLAPATCGLVYNLLAQVQTAAGRTGPAAASRTSAVEALGAAVQGNENSELLQPYALLLSSLRSGGQSR